MPLRCEPTALTCPPACASRLALALRLPGRPRSRVLMGLNFYGNEYVYARKRQLVKAEAALAGRLLEVLRRHAPAPDRGQAAGSRGSSSSSSSTDGSGRQQCSAAVGKGGAGSCAAPRDGGGAAGSSSSGGGDGGGLRIRWLDESREHVFRWRQPGAPSGSGSGKRQRGQQHLLYFPTPAALAARVAAAAARGMGAAVWELGQGMDCFCGLL